MAGKQSGSLRSEQKHRLLQGRTYGRHAGMLTTMLNDRQCSCTEARSSMYLSVWAPIM